jgi:uncharacterized protein (DUF58 family)
MNLYLLLDISGSMECDSGAECSKLQYGSTLAAALAHMALKQRDAVGLTLFADAVVGHLPPKSKPHHLDEILRLIATTKARPISDAARCLHAAAELAKHRGMVVIISDLFDDFDAIVSGIEHLRFRRHEVILFHILDPWERDLSVDGNMRFRDLETGEEIVVRAEGIRGEYVRVVNDWRKRLNLECRNRSVDRIEVTTADPLDRVLLDYLVKRARV